MLHLCTTCHSVISVETNKGLPAVLHWNAEVHDNGHTFCDKGCERDFQQLRPEEKSEAHYSWVRAEAIINNGRKCHDC